MDWSNLPYHITEKFIKYAAEKDEEDSWLMELHKYGQVCRGWKEVIFQSKILFENDKKTNESDDDSKRTMTIDYVHCRLCYIVLKTSYEYWAKTSTEQKLRQMIKDGYLELTTHMTLYGFEGDRDDETLQLIREYAGASSIKSYTVHAWNEDEDCRSAENFSLFIEILKKSKKAECVCFFMDITSRPDFKIFWDTFVAVLQIESVKKVRFDIASRVTVHRAASDDDDLIRTYPDVLLNHIDKIEVDLELDSFEGQSFTYGPSDELTMSDFAKKFNGAYSIRNRKTFIFRIY